MVHVSELYIFEALHSFRAYVYPGTVFLIGAASEGLQLVLRQALDARHIPQMVVIGTLHHAQIAAESP
ncbi:MAG: hypothetical protein A2Y63_02725 [Candidatus Riflebacteria bacterium RBG_13_59_9]|nr:MAG: hypothetical protein A2Y63_02725 [Candidatus Riflebacteria bacterium RBG_13_59_9]